MLNNREVLAVSRSVPNEFKLPKIGSQMSASNRQHNADSSMTRNFDYLGIQECLSSNNGSIKYASKAHLNRMPINASVVTQMHR